MLHGGCAERIGRAEHHFLAGFLELVGEFADRRGFAHAIHADHHDDIRFLVFRQVKSRFVVVAAGGEEGGNLFAQNVLQFRSAHVLVAGHALLDALDNLDGRVCAHVGRNQNLLEVVEHLVIYFAFAGHCAGEFAEKAFFRLFKAGVERFLVFFLRKEIKKSHTSHFYGAHRRVFFYASRAQSPEYAAKVRIFAELIAVSYRAVLVLRSKFGNNAMKSRNLSFKALQNDCFIANKQTATLFEIWRDGNK